MLEITPHPRKNVRCDIAGCKHPIKPLWINEKGSPMPLRFICCETHLREIIEVGKAYLGITDEIPNDELVKQLEAKDIIIEQFQQEIGELKAAIGNLNCNNQELKSKLESLSRPELIKLASSMNISGKLVTFDNKELIKKIKEAQAK